MPSTYVLIEQSEFLDFLHDVEALNSWARKMAGLSTSITAPAPLWTGHTARPDKGPLQCAHATSPYFGVPESSYCSTPQRPAPQQDSARLDDIHHGIAQDTHHVRYGSFSRLPRMEVAPGMQTHGCEHIKSRPGWESRAMPMWQAPVKAGPHRTPNVTRAPSVPHAPHRGVRYVRRPRRVRPERNAEAVEEETEDVEEEQEYVVEEDDGVDVNKREAR